MKWFKHQSDARNSLKLRKVRRKYGADGYAIYWFCLEAIAYEVDKDNLTFDLKEDAETIGFELSVQEKRVIEIMTYMVNIGLFESSNNVITCLKLAESIDKSMTNSPKMRAWIGKNSLSGTSSNVMTLNDTVNTCPELELEVEVEVEVEVEKNKNTIDQQVDLEALIKNDFDYENQFNKFWLSGIRKIGKKQAKAAFLKILKSKKQKSEFTDYLVKDIIWRLENDQLGFSELHPTTYLRNERWTDERRTKTATQGNHGKPSIAERSANETAIIQAKLAAGEFDQRPMGPNDAVVQEQVGFIGGGQTGTLWTGEGGIDAEFSTLVPENGGFDR